MDLLIKADAIQDSRMFNADAEAEIKLSSWGTLLDFFEY